MRYPTPRSEQGRQLYCPSCRTPTLLIRPGVSMAMPSTYCTDCQRKNEAWRVLRQYEHMLTIAESDAERDVAIQSLIDNARNRVLIDLETSLSERRGHDDPVTNYVRERRYKLMFNK